MFIILYLHFQHPSSPLKVVFSNVALHHSYQLSEHRATSFQQLMLVTMSGCNLQGFLALLGYAAIARFAALQFLGAAQSVAAAAAVGLAMDMSGLLFIYAHRMLACSYAAACQLEEASFEQTCSSSALGNAEEEKANSCAASSGCRGSHLHVRTTCNSCCSGTCSAQ